MALQAANVRSTPGTIATSHAMPATRTPAAIRAARRRSRRRHATKASSTVSTPTNSSTSCRVNSHQNAAAALTASAGHQRVRSQISRAPTVATARLIDSDSERIA